jgi:site-specific DNA-methyltransferase (adenine-specific)
LINNKRIERYLPKDYPIPVGKDTIGKYKIFISNAYGCGALGETIPTPILGTPMTLCTENFLRIGSFDDESTAKNVLSYIRTKFFRLLVGIKKITQHTSRETYSLAPMQDWSEEWTDEKLYEKYELSKKEIDFVESMIKPMEV